MLISPYLDCEPVHARDHVMHYAGWLVADGPTADFQPEELFTQRIY